MSDKPDKQLKEIKFYAAILYPDGEYKVEQFDTPDALANRLKSLVDKDVSVFNFAGVQLKVSRPPFRHLLTPWGAKPLFDSNTTELEPDDTGYLGADFIHLSDPPPLSVPKQNKAGGNDEFFDDKEDAGMGVFDDILPDPDS
jgi:hypothetical protein